MVWGAIVPGFRSKLLRCPRSVSGMSHMEMLSNHWVFFQWNRRYGKGGLIWEHDNTPAQGPGAAVMREDFPSLK
jgi:hypothetical protein